MADGRRSFLHRRRGGLAVVLAASLLAFHAAAAAPADGTLLAEAPCPPNPLSSYLEYVEARKRSFAEETLAAQAEGFVLRSPAGSAAPLVGPAEYALQSAYAGCECRQIRYSSDGLAVNGFLWKPRDTAGKKLPLILYNRGGVHESGALTPWMRGGFYDFVSDGFVVLATQYRGNDGGEGHDEYGGAEVRDVLNLLPLARGLGYVVLDNVFVLGWSRGGMTTLLAIKQGLAVNAAAVIAPLSDLPHNMQQRPAQRAKWATAIPDFERHVEASLRERSAIYWPEALSVPLLLVHGNADWRVDAADTLSLAAKLHQLGKPYELVIYDGDDHFLNRHAADADRRIRSWFRAHLR